MTPFTDDDLKRYQEFKAIPNEVMFKALLARLEAAEAVAEHFSYGNTPIGLIETWRKAAGK